MTFEHLIRMLCARCGAIVVCVCSCFSSRWHTRICTFQMNYRDTSLQQNKSKKKIHGMYVAWMTTCCFVYWPRIEHIMRVCVLSLWYQSKIFSYNINQIYVYSINLLAFVCLLHCDDVCMFGASVSWNEEVFFILKILQSEVMYEKLCNEEKNDQRMTCDTTTSWYFVFDHFVARFFSIHFHLVWWRSRLFLEMLCFNERIRNKNEIRFDHLTLFHDFSPFLSLHFVVFFVCPAHSFALLSFSLYLSIFLTFCVSLSNRKNTVLTSFSIQFTRHTFLIQ